MWLLFVQKDIFLPCAESRFRFWHSSVGLILWRRPIPKFVKRDQEVKLKSTTEELGALQTTQNKRIQWGRGTVGVEEEERGHWWGVAWCCGWLDKGLHALAETEMPHFWCLSVKPSPKQPGLSEVTHPRWQQVKWLSRNSPLLLDCPNLALEGCTVESARHGGSHQQTQHLRGWVKSPG